MRIVLASIEEGSETFSLLRAGNLTIGILHYSVPVFQFWTYTLYSVVASHLCELLQKLSYFACLSWLAQVILSARHFRSRCDYAAFCFLGLITTQAHAQVYNIKEHIFIPALVCLRLHRECKQCLPK